MRPVRHISCAASCLRGVAGRGSGSSPLAICVIIIVSSSRISFLKADEISNDFSDCGEESRYGLSLRFGGVLFIWRRRNGSFSDVHVISISIRMKFVNTRSRMGTTIGIFFYVLSYIHFGEK